VRERESEGLSAGSFTVWPNGRGQAVDTCLEKAEQYMRDWLFIVKFVVNVLGLIMSNRLLLNPIII
jgi:hypothetical protein